MGKIRWAKKNKMEKTGAVSGNNGRELLQPFIYFMRIASIALAA